jgi:peroxiredoxin
LEGAVKVSGAEVQVQVRHDDGSPAAGVTVRLLYGRQQTIAVARTDGQGLWAHTVSQTGAYEAIIETGPRPNDMIRLPFSVLEREEATSADRFPSVTEFAALGCLLGALLLLILEMTKAHRRGDASVHLGRLPLLVMAALVTAGIVLLSWSAWGYWQQPAVARTRPSTGPDVARAARDYLHKRKVKPLSLPLADLLADTKIELVKTQPHPLLGHVAPDFELTDHRQESWHLQQRLRRGPVVLVFYYGYHCNHCVGQLFALNDDIQKFRELGAEVVAVSADPPELTQERFRQYGTFAFPVLTDPGNKIAQAYRVYQPASEKAPDELQHGTFVIGSDGRMAWAQYGSEPFTGNRTLLHELARLQGRLPKTKTN